MDTNFKLVDFVKCEKCKHFDTPDYEDPCDECLSVAARPDTHTPLYFEEKEK